MLLIRCIIDATCHYLDKKIDEISDDIDKNTIAKISEVLMSDRTDEECIYLICELLGLEEEE